MARGSRRRRRWARACLPGALVAAALLLPLSGAAGRALVTVYPSFSPGLALRTDLAPAAMEIADLNGDEKPDVVTANRLGNDVSVFLNAGDGSFGPRRDYTTSSRPGSLAIADVDGDGDRDLVTGSQGAGAGGMVSVLVNSGDGSFGTKRDYPTVATPTSVAIGDLDDDRKPDLAVAMVDTDLSGAGVVAVLGNDGNGAFQAPRLYPLGADPASVAIGDLNADGRADLATANTYAGNVSVLLNDGHGGFPARHDYSTGDWAPAVAIGDLNADGRADLIAGHFDRFVSIFFNRGVGTLDPRRDYQTGRYSNDVAIGDLNGDGSPELATANYQSNTVSVLTNWGDGGFLARRDYGVAVDPWSVAIGDLNGDGKPELAAASEDADEVSVLANTTGLCKVPGVHKKTVAAAKRAIRYGLCRFGGLRRAYSSAVPKGRVLSATPRSGTVLPTGSTVRLLVSRGRRR